MKCSDVSFWIRGAAQGYTDLQETTSQTWSNVRLIQEKAHSSHLYPLHHPLSYMYFLFVSCYHFLILSKVRWENQSGLRAKADKQHEDKLLTSQTVKCHIARTYVFKSSQDGNRKRRYVLLWVKKRVIMLELWGQRWQEESVERLKFGNSENLSTREIASPSRVSF